MARALATGRGMTGVETAGIVLTKSGLDLGVTPCTAHFEQQATHRRFVIRVRQGLPALRFAWVTAHALTHAWLWINDLTVDQDLEEGLGELSALWVLNQLEGPTAARLRSQLLAASDPVRGTPFLRAKAMEGQRGWPAVREQVLAGGGWT